MAADLGPGAAVGWLQSHGTPSGLAGCAFLIGPDIALTCAHVIGAHLGLRKPVPTEQPTEAVRIHFEALQDEVTGRVLPGGWFSNARPPPGGLSDIAVVRLDKPVLAISPLPAIAQRMPTQSRPVLIHGAEADYKSYGQQVQGEMGGSNIPRGWRQINPRDSERGFTVEEGFSGSAVLDDLGNVVWGMVVAVAEQGSGVAYAIPAEDLWAALGFAGAETTVRVSDATDRRAEEAMAKVRAEYEAQLAKRDSEAQRMRQELDHLRQGVRGLEQEARESPDQEAAAALDALIVGDVLPATEVLRRKMEERLAVSGEARREAAAAARQLGTMLKLVDSASALKAFRQAADCDPDDFWTWIEIGRLEQIAGDLDGAAKAIDAARQAEVEDERCRGVAFSDRGDLCFSQGDLSAALTSYQASLAIRDRLAKADPGNAVWQRDVAVSNERIGDVQSKRGETAKAIAAFDRALNFYRELQRRNPADVPSRVFSVVPLWRLGRLRGRKGRTDLEAALAILEPLAATGRLDANRRGWIKLIQNDIVALRE